jgi:hypothetical protein
MAPVAAMAAVTLPAGNALAAPQTYPNACRNSAVPTNWDQVSVINSATSPAGPVSPGDTVPLTNITTQMSIPGAIFVAGYNLGLLTKGVNNIPGHISQVIDGANTTQGSQSTNTVDSVLTTTITDPDGTASTGDETASDASTLVNFADMSWTAGTGGPIAFAEHNDKTLTGSSGGGLIAIADLAGGIIKVQFHCTAGSVAGSNPGTPTFADAPAFATTAAGNHAPVCSAGTVTVPHATRVTVNLSCTDADAGQTLTRTIVTNPAHGTLGAVSGGTVTYKPRTTYGGSDSFTFKATDNQGGVSNTARITLKVKAGKTLLTAKSSAAKVKAGVTFRLRGRLQDATTKAYLNGQRIYLQRRPGASGKWATRTSKLTARVSGVNGVVVFKVKQSRAYYYRLVYKGTAAYQASRSAAVRVRMG